MIVRVDADERIGFGHLTRCLALSGRWPGRVLLAAAAGDSDMLGPRTIAAGATPVEIAADRGSIDDARATAALAHASGAEWVVVDGYHFDTEYQRALVTDGLRVLCIDDNGEAGGYACDIVLNQNLHADAALYARRGPGTRLLLGPRFVLLRDSFLQRGQPVRTFESFARRILVTLGGGDAGPVLPAVIEALARAALPRLDVTVVGATPDDRHAVLPEQASQVCGQVTLLDRTDAMADLMSAADLAISGGGSTSWELAYMGVPAMVVTMARNQTGAVRALVDRGIAAGLGPAGHVDPEVVAREIEALARDGVRRRAMSAAGQALVDGHGVARVIAAMHAFPAIDPRAHESIGAEEMKDTQ